MTSAVKRTVPPRAVIRTVNPAVRMVLHSPLHGLLDPSVVVLHVTGRKAGRQYHVPVSGGLPVGHRLGRLAPGAAAGHRGGGRPAPTLLELKDAAAAHGWSVVTLTPR